MLPLPVIHKVITVDFSFQITEIFDCSGIIGAVVLSAALKNPSEFAQLCQRAVTYSFWHGAHAAAASSTYTAAQIVQDSKQRGWGTPGPMMAVRGLPTELLQQHVKKVNQSLSQHICISLKNTAVNHVVSGPPIGIYQLRLLLSSISAQPGEDQTRFAPIPFLSPSNCVSCRVLFSKRKPEIAMDFLATSAPFHSPLLQPAADLIIENLKRCGFNLRGSDLAIPVWSTDNMANMQDLDEIGESLVLQQLVRPVDFHAVCQRLVRDNDFAPGESSNR